jgi:hypothetical protein
LVLGLVDGDAGRIVDYVNLAGGDDFFVTPIFGIDQSSHTNYFPSAAAGNLWSTNHFVPTNVFSPTWGIQNHIAVCIGWVQPTEYEWRNFSPFIANPTVRLTAQYVFRRALLNASSDTNVFYTPFDHARTVFLNYSWVANDPLVHYTPADLDWYSITNQVELDRTIDPSIRNIRRVNYRYEPWTSVLPSGSMSLTRFDLALKDPLVARSDDWDLPEAQPFSPAWLGRAHRGTPWQTIDLKATMPNLSIWSQWTGFESQEAALVHPSLDRPLVAQLAVLLNTNPPANLASLNPESVAGWLPVLDSIAVLSNSVSEADLLRDPFLGASFDPLMMWSNSAQAGLVAEALEAARAGAPGGRFQDIGSLLAVPELSVESPWVDGSTSQLRQRGISDAAYEAIPAALLARLRPESVATVLGMQPDQLRIQFSGSDRASYRVEYSTNLVDWGVVSIQTPVNGVFEVPRHRRFPTSAGYYRTVFVGE